jgi:HTH-type transcriptional regulator / antitoxin HigA
MDLQIIKTDEQYRSWLEVLAKLIDDYEKERVTFRKPDPIEAILFRMEEQGLRQADIAAIVGGKNRASAILRVTKRPTKRGR